MDVKRGVLCNVNLSGRAAGWKGDIEDVGDDGVEGGSRPGD